MATLYITQYGRIAHDGAGQAVLAGLEPTKATETVAIGGASAASTVAFVGKFVRLHCDAVCHVKFGASPTATTSDMRLAANQTEFFGVPGDGACKVAVIAGV